MRQKSFGITEKAILSGGGEKKAGVARSVLTSSSFKRLSSSQHFDSNHAHNTRTSVFGIASHALSAWRTKLDAVRQETAYRPEHELVAGLLVEQGEAVGK